jgi:hypothetical protein
MRLLDAKEVSEILQVSVARVYDRSAGNLADGKDWTASNSFRRVAFGAMDSARR